MSMKADGCLQPTLDNIINQESLKWIFVGGKGGVGKTICCCSIALQLSEKRENVLIVSTDPAHNLSDTFDQKFLSSPTLVHGFNNLYAMEIDPKIYDIDESNFEEDEYGIEFNSELWKTIRTSIPGIDEALTYVTVLKLVRSMNYSVVMFDTAPTGHTLRLLAFPGILEKLLEKLIHLRNAFPLFRELSTMIGIDSIIVSNECEELLESIKILNKQFTNPELTTFICVCNASFLSLYENERLIQELAASSVDTRNIIVNKLHNPIDSKICKLCSSWINIEAKYLDQIDDLYKEDFHLIKVPMIDKEIRGVEQIRNFSKFFLSENKLFNIDT